MIGIFLRPPLFLGLAIGMTLSHLVRQWSQMANEWRLNLILTLAFLFIATALTIIHKKSAN